MASVFCDQCKLLVCHLCVCDGIGKHSGHKILSQDVASQQIKVSWNLFVLHTLHHFDKPILLDWLGRGSVAKTKGDNWCQTRSLMKYGIGSDMQEVLMDMIGNV